MERGGAKGVGASSLSLSLSPGNAVMLNIYVFSLILSLILYVLVE